MYAIPCRQETHTRALSRLCIRFGIVVLFLSVSVVCYCVETVWRDWAKCGIKTKHETSQSRDRCAYVIKSYDDACCNCMLLACRPHTWANEPKGKQSLAYLWMFLPVCCMPYLLPAHQNDSFVNYVFFLSFWERAQIYACQVETTMSSDSGEKKNTNICIVATKEKKTFCLFLLIQSPPFRELPRSRQNKILLSFSYIEQPAS